MNRNLRKRKVVGVTSTRSNKAESPTTTSEQPNKKAKIEEDEVEDKPLDKVQTETEDKVEEKKQGKDEELDEEQKKSITSNAESEETKKKTEDKQSENDEVEVLTPAKVTETITIDEKTEEVVEEVVVDPYAFLSDSDRKLMQTDIVEFLKRFTPRYFVPVYRTWSIPKSVAKQT